MFDKTANELALTAGNLHELDRVARAMIDFAAEEKVWLFEGMLGAGKTTLIKALGRAFGVVDNVQSPSFAIVNEYRNEEEEVFYHFDFYRIKDETEAIDIGVDEYLYSGNYCFIEWPEKINSLLPDQYLKVFIGVNADNSRSISLSKYGQSS